MFTKFLLILFICGSCDGNFNIAHIGSSKKDRYIQTSGNTVGSRAICPEGFKRVPADSTSFTAFLRNLPLKPFGTDVKYYNGIDKKEFVHIGVIDMPIGDTDLQQCADSGIRLYAEYLYYAGLHDEIQFNFTNGERCSWVRYAEGWRVSVKGNETEWHKATGRNYTYGNFSAYLDLVYLYAGSYSLSKQMKPVHINDIQPGDFLVHPGFPGHVEIVMDVCINPENDEKLFLLAQGFTPAQEIEILKNESDPASNPWYSTSVDRIITPQAEFSKEELMRFK